MLVYFFHDLIILLLDPIYKHQQKSEEKLTTEYPFQCVLRILLSPDEDAANALPFETVLDAVFTPEPEKEEVVRPQTVLSKFNAAILAD